MTVTVSVPELRARLDEVRLLDVRWQLGVPDGRPAYTAGHVPGAVYVDLESTLSARPGPGDGRHPLPGRDALQDAARAWGINDGDTVVAYDDSGNLAAARAWWLLRHAGLTDVRLLDGGLAAWVAAGQPLETGVVTPEPGTVTLEQGELPVIDIDEAAGWPARGVLLDARAGERYRGEVEPVDPRAGHIPGAVSAPTGSNLAADGTFLPADELRARFAGLGVGPGDEVAVYCGSGVTAAHTIAALRILAEARRIIDVHDAALRLLEAERGQTIVVGSTEHSAEQILPEMIRALQAAFPDCATRFEIGRSTQLAEAVGKGAVDLAFVLDPSGQGAGHLVGRLPLVWYAARGWTPPTPGDTWPLIAFEEPCGIRERALSVLTGEGHRVEVTAQSTTLEGVLAGVRAGLGVALLPSAGGRPSGLSMCGELPDAGTTHLRMVARRGLPAELEQTALSAGVEFFAERPHLQLVSSR